MRKSQFRLFVAMITSFAFTFSATASPASGKNAGKPEVGRKHSQRLPATADAENVAAAVAKKEAAPVDKDKVAAVERFFKLVNKPEPRSYRQMLQSIKPFVSAEFIRTMEKKVGSQLDLAFPKYQLKDAGKVYLLKVSTGSQKTSMLIFKDNPHVFGLFEGVEILHSDVGDAMKVLAKIEAGMKKAGKPTAKSALMNLFVIESAQAEISNWALIGGLGILGAGIALGAYFLSRSKIKTESKVDVKVPRKYSVDVDADASFDLPFINRDGKK